MRVHAEDGFARYIRVFRIDTGEELKWLRFADDDAGVYEQIRHDADGNVVVVDGEAVIDRIETAIRIERGAP